MIPPRLLILGYHKIGDHPAGEPSFSYVPVEAFARQLASLVPQGWRFLSADQWLQALEQPERLCEKSAVITLDDGYLRTLTHALPVLRDLGAPAVLFVPTRFVGGTNDFDAGIEPEEPICTWDQLRQLDLAGVSIQSHGVGHRWMSELDQAARQRELLNSRDQIRQQIGHEAHFFSFPYGDEGVDPATTQALLERTGYRGAVLFGGGAMDGRSIDRWRMQRLPVGPDTDFEKELLS